MSSTNDSFFALRLLRAIEGRLLHFNSKVAWKSQCFSICFLGEWSLHSPCDCRLSTPRVSSRVMATVLSFVQALFGFQQWFCTSALNWGIYALRARSSTSPHDIPTYHHATLKSPRHTYFIPADTVQRNLILRVPFFFSFCSYRSRLEIESHRFKW